MHFFKFGAKGFQLSHWRSQRVICIQVQCVLYGNLLKKFLVQNFFSTHSGDLLSEVPPESIIRLYQNNGCVTSKRLKDVHLMDKQRRQFNYHIRQARGELLFARCWILGEGETEVTLIPELARILKKNLEKNGIRCIAYRQSDISLFIQVADAMGIHWIAIPDSDSQGRSDQIKIRSRLKGEPGKRSSILYPKIILRYIYASMVFFRYL